MNSQANQAKSSGTTHGSRIAREHSVSSHTLGLPWLQWTPGERVVLRYRLPDGLHDALGILMETTIDYVVIQTRRGPVRVEAATMVTGKKVPSAPRTEEIRPQR